MRDSLRAKHPDMKLVDISKLIGQQWNALSESEKEKYYQEFEQSKITYEKEKAQLQSQGFFVNAQGEKSTDLFKPKLSDDVV